MVPVKTVLKDPTFWLTCIIWFLCLVLTILPYVSNTFPVVQKEDAVCNPDCEDMTTKTMPKLGLLLIGTTAPLHFIITTGHVLSFLFEADSPQAILIIIFSIFGFITFIMVIVIAATFSDIPTFEIILLVIYAITALCFLANAISGYKIIGRENKRRVSLREGRGGVVGKTIHV